MTGAPLRATALFVRASLGATRFGDTAWVAGALAALQVAPACVEQDAVAVEVPCANGGCASGGGGGVEGGLTGGASGDAASGGVGPGWGGTAEADSGPELPLYSLVVDAPRDDSIASGLVTVRGRAPGFVNVEIWDATHQNPALAQTAPAANGAFSAMIDVSNLPEGATRWTVWAWDSEPGQPFQNSASRVLRLTIEHPAATCEGRTCSGHGACSVSGGLARCTCDAGYRASGLACITDGAVETCAARAAAPGHVAPTCVRKALFGGAYLDMEAYAQKLGRDSLQIATHWDDVLAAPQGQTPEQDWGWVANHYSTEQWVVRAQWPGALALGMPMWMRGQSPQLCASGTSDGDMRRAITTLKAMVGARDVYIRLGWQFNASFYPTQKSEGDAAYQQAWKDCWIRWYDIVKDVDPAFMLVWNPHWANNGACQSGFSSVFSVWPGKEFVDAAGPAQYDATWCGRPAAANEMDGDQPVGIGAWADWAIAEGVPFAVPEWGVDSGASGNGDRPQFVRDVHAALKKAHAAPSGVAFQTYFDGGATYSCRFSLLDPACSKNPRASAEYFQLFRVWPPE